jgi:hypothetical protein
VLVALTSSRRRRGARMPECLVSGGFSRSRFPKSHDVAGGVSRVRGSGANASSYLGNVARRPNVLRKEQRGAFFFRTVV